MVPVTVIMTAGLALITFLTKAMLVRTPGLLLKNLWLTGQHLPVKPILPLISRLLTIPAEMWSTTPHQDV